MQVKNPKHIWQLPFEGDWPTAVTFLGDNQTLAAGNRLGQIVVWKLSQNPSTSANDAPKGKTESQGKANKKEKESPASAAPVLKLNGHTNGVTHLVWDDNSKRLISSSLDGDIRLWDVNAPPQGEEEIVLDAKVREQNARRKPKAERDAILNAPGAKVQTLNSTHVFGEENEQAGHEGWILSLGISADGARLISGDDRCWSIIWDLKSRKPVTRWQGHDRVWVRSAALNSNGKTAFTCEYAGSRSSFDVPAAQARLWNADNGQLTTDLLQIWTPEVKDKDRIDSYGYRRAWSKLLKRGLVCAAFSPNDKLLAVGQGGETATGQVLIVDVASGKILRTISGHQSGACDVKFSADGKYVLSSGRDTCIRVCQAEDGKEVAVLGKPRGGQFKDWIHSLAISADQSKVAGADIAGMVHVWQLQGDANAD